MSFPLKLSLFVVILAVVYVFYLPQRILMSLRDNSTCPFCYGESLCEGLYGGKLTLNINWRLLGDKNVYNGIYDARRVFVKKLGTSQELNDFDNLSLKQINKSQVIEVWTQNSKEFFVCDQKTAQLFLGDLEDQWKIQEIWTLANINCEPFILRVFEGFSVPDLIGCCGRTVVVEDSGKMLNEFERTPWLYRAYIALQLMKSGVDFTFKHPVYRFYLTDLSPDNIAVDPNSLKVTFIDLESGILTTKNNKTRKLHNTMDFEEYVYSNKEICASSISDHNIYSICKLFLSRKSPWPMMKNGLLHSPPISVIVKYKQLFRHVRYCVVSRTKRFYHAMMIINFLRDILSDYKFAMQRNK